VRLKASRLSGVTTAFEKLTLYKMRHGAAGPPPQKGGTAVE